MAGKAKAAAIVKKYKKNATRRRLLFNHRVRHSGKSGTKRKKTSLNKTPDEKEVPDEEEVHETAAATMEKEEVSLERQRSDIEPMGSLSGRERQDLKEKTSIIRFFLFPGRSC